MRSSEKRMLTFMEGDIEWVAGISPSAGQECNWQLMEESVLA
jgi:hypothetical protein